MGIRIREMIDSDWNRVAKIYEQGISVGSATFQTECPSYDDWDASHLEECRYVAIIEREVVGFAVISATSRREAYRGVVEVSIYIDERYRGEGIGTELLTHLCEESEKMGFWSLYAAIIEDNKASIALHEKCGFRKIGYREKIAKDKDGEWKNTILMEKRSSKIL